MMNRILLVWTVIISSISLLTAQDQFDREYPTTNREMTAIDLSSNSADNFFILSTFEDNGANAAQGLNLTKLSPKGDLDWSIDYILEDSIAVLDVKGEIDVSNGDEYYISYYLDDDESTDNTILMKTETNGEMIWTKRFYPARIDSSLNSYCQVRATGDQVYLGATQVDSFSNRVMLNRINGDGDNVWTRQFITRDANGELQNAFYDDLHVAIDSSLLMLSTLRDVDDGQILTVTNIDTMGNIIAANSYLDDSPSTLDISGLEMISLPDSTKVIVGSRNNQGLIFKLDTLNEVIWAKRVSILSPNSLENIVLSSDGRLVVQGTIFAAVGADAQRFILKLDQDGNVIWQSLFPDFAGFFDFRGDLIQMTMGTAYASTEFEGPVPTNRLLRLDPEGATGCEDTLSMPILSDVLLSRDTMIWEIEERDTVRDLQVRARGFDAFDIPVLSLRDTMFCPGDPVEFLLDATTNGAVSYTWTEVEDGNTTVVGTDSTFLATKIDVQYIATVRVEDRNCLTLCDTTMLTEISPPMVSLNLDNSQYCDDPDNQFFTLIASSSGADEIVWSTGATNTASIQVTEFRDYAVTVTNRCDDTATASISVSAADIPSGEPIPIGAVFGDGCDRLIVTLVIQDNGENYTDISWSTGDNTPTISVDQPGTYMVNATDACGRSVTGSATLSANDFLQPVPISIIRDDSALCDDNTITLTVAEPERFSSIEWNTGDTTPSITISDADDYSVTAVDECGLQSQADIEISSDDFYEEIRNLELNGEFQCVADPDGGQMLEPFDLGFSVAGGDSDRDNIEWSTGSSSQTITVSEEGVYSLTITDQCGVQLTEQILVQCGSCNIDGTFGDDDRACLCFANVFFPQNVNMNIDVEDRQFRPVNYCQDIEDYRMIIYSRWGNQVFETTDVSEAWDGMKGGDRAPAEVYVVYARYSIAGEAFEYKGNLTLLR